MSEDKAMVVRALPEDVSALRTFAADAAASAFSAFKRPQDALLAVLTGRDLGLSAAQSVRAFHVIEGRPTLSADAMVAVCVARRDLCSYFRTVESSPDRCVVETQRVGEPTPRRLTFSMAEARTAGLAGRKMWQTYPAQMLRARAKSALARDTYPDLLLGIYDPDELGGETWPAGPQPSARSVGVEVAESESVEAEVAEPVPDSLADEYVSVIERETSLESLAALAPKIQALAFSEQELARVRGAWSARRSELRSQLQAGAAAVTEAVRAAE